MAHSRLAASGKVNTKRNIHSTENLPASGRLRTIFAKRYEQKKRATSFDEARNLKRNFPETVSIRKQTIQETRF